MKQRLEAIVRRALGDQARMDAFEKWGFGALNDTYKVVACEPAQVLFVKIERDGIVPTTRRGQIAREVASMQLMRKVGIDCPVVVGHDTTGREVGCRYLVEQFIGGELMWELRERLSAEEREYMRGDVGLILEKMSQISGEWFGDLQEGGPLGRHATWRSVYCAMTGMLLDDARGLELFTQDQQQVVEEAMDRACGQLVSTCPAGWYHGDLGLHNVMVDRSNGHVRVGKVIDFGNAWFCPIYANEDGCRRYGGFGLDVQDVAGRYGVERGEYEANDLLFALEHAVFMGMLARRGNQPVQGAVEPFLQKCHLLTGQTGG